MIYLKSYIRKLSISERVIKNHAQKALAAIGKPDAVLSVTLVGDARMKTLNTRFRDEPKATDVLSFPMTAVETGRGADAHPAILGDLVFNMHAVARQANEMGHSELIEFCALLAHGLAHLEGHTHKSAKEKSAMKKSESKILAAIATKVKAGSLLER